MEKTVKTLTAVAPPYPDGQRLDTIVIAYIKDVDSLLKDGPDLSSYTVEGRTILRVYTNDVPRRSETSKAGQYCILELDDREEAAKIIPEPPKADHGPQGGFHPDGVPNLPQQERRPIRETVSQVRRVKAADGSSIECWTQETDRVLQPVIDDFVQGQFEDLPYNLFTPLCAPGVSYPLVVFLHDAGPNGSDPFLTLAQGTGAVSFASPRDQEKHPAFVLAPQIPKEVHLTSDNYTCAPQIETVKALIDRVVSENPIDPERVYWTGQSQGCMGGFELNSRYPDFFAASLMAAGQWDAARVGSACPGGNFWMLASDGDLKACPGMDAITAALEANGAKAKRYHWNAKWPSEKLNAAAEAASKDEVNVRFTIFDDHSVIPDGADDNPGANHMATWACVYPIEALRDWLFTQRRPSAAGTEQEQMSDSMQELFARARKDDPKALGMLGEAYLRGNDGFIQDYEKAFIYSDRAARLGNYRSFTVLGMLYQDGHYVERNIEKALECYEKASAGGDFKAPRMLGMLYEAGEKVPQDYEKAAGCYTLAADAGDITGQYLLGQLYEKGLGVPQDYEKAMTLYLQSAERGDQIAAPAIGAVANLYRNGWGVPQDDVLAQEWQEKYEAAMQIRLH